MKIAKLPLLAQIVNAGWIKQHSNWFAELEDMPNPIWYEQVEVDLTALADKVSVQKLALCYRSMLRDRHNFLDAAYEIHGAAFLARIGQKVDLHVPRGPKSQVNYDVRVEIDGVPIHADCKARRDEFPLKSSFKDPEGGYSGSRAALDPHDGAALGLLPGTELADMKYVATPESTVVRQLLGDALIQLPDDGVNMVLFGQIFGDREHLERALFRGAPVCDFVIDNATKKVVGTEWRQVGSTAFSDPAFTRLSGVLWMRMTRLFGPLRHHYSLYVNPNAKAPIPPAVVALLDEEITCRTTSDVGS